MKNIVIAFFVLTVGISYGNTEKEIFELVPSEKLISESTDLLSNFESNDDSVLDCYEIAHAYLEAVLSSGMLINEAYDAAFAAYQTCEAINMM
ncbi:MAG: hypothetical protein ACX93O_01360 [Flagellimonas sp.]